MDDRNLKIYNDVTRKLLKEFTKDTNKNVFFSPLSVLVVLGMLMDATEGETREEILRAIKSGICSKAMDSVKTDFGRMDSVETDFGKMDSVKMDSEKTDFGKTDPVKTDSVDSEKEDLMKMKPEEWIQWISEIGRELAKSGALMSSNAVCVNETMNGKILPEYETRLRDHFDGKLFVTKNLAKAVNEWVNKATKGMIQEIADESINSRLACLLNAIAFDAKWLKKVKQDDIEFGEFTNADKSVSEVTMISSTELQYIEDTYFTGFTKPYKDVGFSYMALLPKMKNSKFLDKAISDIDFTDLYQSKCEEEVVVEIPEHKMDFGQELNQLFEELGIRKIFSEKAEFAPMTNEWIKVDSLLHKAHIEVDRNGTKAAAVTAAIVCAGCADVPMYKEVILDRPFVFSIVHNDTGLPVFAGVVNHVDEGEYNIERVEVEEPEFETEEEADQYLEALYQRIKNLVPSENISLYEEAEEIRRLLGEAESAYENKFIYWLQIVEHNLKCILDENEQE